MPQEMKEPDLLTRYLLGELAEEEALRIEERYFADETFYEELLEVERDLIDRYIAGEMSEARRLRFEQYFMASESRRRKVRFAGAFRRLAADHPAARPAPDTEGRGKVLRPKFGRVLTSPWLRAAALLLIAAGAAVGVWRLWFTESRAEKGLAALARAYPTRPVEARLTGMPYQQYVTERGEGPPAANQTELERARILLFGGAPDSRDPELNHALGKYHFTQRNFEEARRLFEAALRDGGADPGLLSDLGAVLFEMGKQALERDEIVEGQELLKQSTERLQQALEIDASNLPARFNLALVYKSRMMNRQAVEQFREYLKRDATSPWANEAQSEIESLESSGARQEFEQLYEQFLAACRAKDEEAAVRLFNSAYLRAGNRFAHRLIDDALRAGAEGDAGRHAELAGLLAFVGEAVRGRTGDTLVSKQARWLRRANRMACARLLHARELFKRGDAHLARAEYDRALPELVRAGDLFAEAGEDGHESLANYLIGFCEVRRLNAVAGLGVLQPLSRHCEAAGYVWLLHRIYYISSNAHELEMNLALALDKARTAYEIAMRVGDVTGQVMSCGTLAATYQRLGRFDDSLAFVYKGLSQALRQALQAGEFVFLYDIAAGTCIARDQPRSALAFQLESLHYAREVGNDYLLAFDRVRLAEIEAKIGRHEDALESLRQAEQIAEAMGDSRNAQDLLALVALRRGDLHRALGRHKEAIAEYDRNNEIAVRLNVPLEAIESARNKALCQMALNDPRAAEVTLREALNRIEQQRIVIRDESLRTAYFEREQAAYELAAELEYSWKGSAEGAFDFIESARDRSLLDLMAAGAPELSGAESPDLRLRHVAPSLSAAEIQRRMPEGVCLLVYAALEKRLLIWLVSRGEMISQPVEISRDDLRERVRRCRDLLAKPGPSIAPELRAALEDLYRTLIVPVSGRLQGDAALCIVADQTLASLPFGALLHPETGQYLIEEYGVLYAPSATLFILCTEAGRARVAHPQEKALIVGNPSFSRDAFPKMPALPAAAAEARRLATLYPSRTLLVGAEATEARVRAELPLVDVAHFATHYLPDRRSPLLSKLLLARSEAADATQPGDDGCLDALEVYLTRLPRLRLAVLAACQTAADNAYRGEGGVGLARAFLAAGTPLVIASLWPVDSAGTAALLSEFHRERQRRRALQPDGHASVAALRAAQLRLCRGKNPQFQHPYFWAGFTAAGGFVPY